MQKIFLIFSCFCVFFGLGAFAAAAQDKTADKADVKQLEAIYREFDEAVKTRDLKIYEKYLDERFEIESGDNKVPRARIIEGIKQFLDSLTEISEAASKIEKVRVTGGNYFLEVSSVLKARLKMPDGRIANVEFNTKSTDVWIKTEKGWKEISQIERGSKILVDGKEPQ
jgi:ketosteroid isomerase-like protein